MITSRLCIFIASFIPAYAFGGNSAPWVGADFDNTPCTGRPQGYGPYDYTKANERPNIPIVEGAHFTYDVENLIKGQTGHLTGDLFYTLSAVPNHHRALLTLIRYQLNLNNHLATKETEKPLPTPVECVFYRAMHFSPDDAATISLFAYYLKQIGKYEKSQDYYEMALNLDPDNAKIQYSYSFLLLQMKNYDKAAEHAKKAYELGTPPETLKKRLEKLGKW